MRAACDQPAPPSRSKPTKPNTGQVSGLPHPHTHTHLVDVRSHVFFKKKSEIYCYSAIPNPKGLGIDKQLKSLNTMSPIVAQYFPSVPWPWPARPLTLRAFFGSRFWSSVWRKILVSGVNRLNLTLVKYLEKMT